MNTLLTKCRLLLFFLFITTQLPAEEYFIVLLVDAPHLNYSNFNSLLKSIAKHPNYSKEGDVGHAWFHLDGYVDNKHVFLEGGHSGERRIKYVDKLANAIESNHPNPAATLFEPLNDGFFQPGSGGHIPTTAAKFPLTESQFREILKWIQHYPYTQYSLTGQQCTTLVMEIAAMLNCQLNCWTTLKLPTHFILNKQALPLWKNPDYRSLTFASPDALEGALQMAIKSHQAEDALNWYLKTHKQPSRMLKTVLAFPKRVCKLTFLCVSTPLR